MYSKEKQRECKVLRAMNDLTVYDVAEMCDTSIKSVYRYETGQYVRDSEIMDRLDYFYEELKKKER